jgi:hypothetical protein
LFSRDNRIYIYYTDTNSLYIKEKDENKIQQLYIQTYSVIKEGTTLG